MKDKPSILVVDDEPANVMLLEAYLIPQGYNVVKAFNGEEALKVAEKESIDLVLMDVMMPGIDGFSATRALKNSEKTKLVPIVLVTSLKETSDRIKGLEAGCDDFMSKPFDKNELMARVKTSLRIKALQDQVQEDYKKLQELEKMKDSLTHMIVHDLNNPLTVVSLKLELMSLRSVSGFTPEQAEDFRVASSAVKELMRMISNLLDVNKMEEGKITLRAEKFDVCAIGKNVAEEMQVIAKSEKKNILFEMPDDGLEVTADKELIRRVIVNLLNNAIKFTPSQGTITLRIWVEATDGACRVCVSDSGEGIPKEYIQKIFEKFVQVETPNAKKGRGLGLTFCKMAVEAHGGRIWAESEPGQGSSFIFTLPK